MAKATKKKRRRKQRGTQAGSVGRRSGRPRSRAEARARAKSRAGSKRSGAKGRAPTRGVKPPTWQGAINRGLIAAGIFLALLVLLFKRPFAEAFALSAFMLVLYIPMGYYMDRFFFRMRQRREQRERLRREAEKEQA